MSKVAIIEAKSSRNNYKQLFYDEFEFSQYALCSDPSVEKVLKKNVDIEFNSDEFDWVILVGAEASKYFTNIKSVTEYSGKIVDKKFIPVMNPSMLKFKPEAEPLWAESRNNIISIINGDIVETLIDETIARGISSKEEAIKFISEAINCSSPFISLDSETTDLYPRNGHVLGISMSYNGESGVYILADVIDEEVEELLQKLFNTKTIVFHNAKFDIGFFQYQFGFEFPEFEDTMLEHYILDETVGTHGLKQLALKYTKYGDYEKPMNDWIATYSSKNGILKADFNYGMIPFDVIKTYAAMDAVATYLLHVKFNELILKNPKFTNIYYNVLLPATRFLVDMQDAGIPFDLKRLVLAQDALQKEIYNAVEELNKTEEVIKFISENKEFNPNSTVQLRKLLFDYLKLKPTKRLTAKGERSTDAEALEELSLQHPIPKLIIAIRKLTKIKNTYIDKIIPQLDKDSRIRTGFNLHIASSGRLTSSGKINAQQFPRDNPLVKGCIVADEGYSIVSGDLVTAEVYVAAVLSKDKALQQVFIDKGNFHSAIAKRVFGLPGPVEDIAKYYPMERQFAKAITFGIMYGAGPHKIWSEINSSGGNISLEGAKEVIDEYFESFKGLKTWLDDTRASIQSNKFIYSFFGRKRRLNLSHKNKGMIDHEIRSGLNFVVQSPASDINLIGALEAHDILKERKMKSKIFALVHDSILAHVKNEETEEYIKIVTSCIQKDRGISIKGCPIGIEFDTHKDYSMGKLEEKYPELCSQL